MNILLATPLYSQHYDSGHFWLRALQELRHNVRVWDYRLEPALFLQHGWTFDVAIVLKGEGVDPRILSGTRFCYWPDNFERNPGIENILQYYDQVFTPVRPTPEGYEWLVTGYDPLIHRSIPTEKDIRTLYIGTNNSPRKAKFIKELSPYVLAGNKWENEPYWRETLPPQYLGDFVLLANRAMIAINIHQGDVGVNRKLFELIPCTFTITDLVPGVEEILGEELAKKVGFITSEGAQKLIDYYLEHPGEREELWEMEKQKIKGYTYLEAAKKVLSFLR